MDSLRKIAAEVVDLVLSKGAYSNIVLNARLNNSKLEDRDKALVTEIVYGTLKYRYTIDKILMNFLTQKLQKMDGLVLNLLRISLYQINYLDKIPSFAAVNEAVELAKRHKGLGASKLINGVLRNYLRNKDKSFYDEKNKIEALSYKYSFEPWMTKIFVGQYGDNIGESILEGLNSTPSLTVRVNSIKSSYEEAFEKLKTFGYEAEVGAVCPEAIRIVKGSSIERNPLFKDGGITVQDESAMLVAPSLEPKLDEVVLDLCSAPGGKTTHLSELMNNTGKVYAFDIHKDKLNLIRENANRLGITNIEYGFMDATILDSDFINFADKVLIDVPCSGLGIIRKKPEIKWTKSMKELKSIVQIQRKILENASQYVKKGGTMLYSTCTINKKENEDNIEWFIKNFNNFKIETLFFGKLDNIIYNKFGVTILPNKYMDGFFITKLKKIR